MAGGIASLSRLCRASRWLVLASLGMMLTCGTNTGTGNAAPPSVDVGAAVKDPG